MSQPPASTSPLVIVAGFGLPGRCVAEVLDAKAIPYAVIDANQHVAARAGSAAPKFVVGDAREKAVLVAAGIESARLLIITIPDEKAAIEVMLAARRIKPDIRVFARCTFTSSGLRARKLGADEVIVAEQVVAEQFAVLMRQSLATVFPEKSG